MDLSGLGKKVGGLPLWGWGAAAGGAVAVVGVLRKQGKAAPIAPNLDVNPQPLTSTGLPTDQTTLQLLGGIQNSLAQLAANNGIGGQQPTDNHGGGTGTPPPTIDFNAWSQSLLNMFRNMQSSSPLPANNGQGQQPPTGPTSPGSVGQVGVYPTAAAARNAIGDAAIIAKAKELGFPDWVLLDFVTEYHTLPQSLEQFQQFLDNHGWRNAATNTLSVPATEPANVQAAINAAYGA